MITCGVCGQGISDHEIGTAIRLREILYYTPMFKTNNVVPFCGPECSMKFYVEHRKEYTNDGMFYPK